MIENFRRAAGLGNVFRSAQTDILGGLDSSQLDGPDTFVAKKPGLIVDLRSPYEVDDNLAQKWTAEHGVQRIEYDSYNAFEKQRAAVRMDILSPSRMLAFVEKEWLSNNPTEQEKAAELLKSGSAQEQHLFVCEHLNEHGLAGLNRLILESGGAALCKALMLITKRFEANADDVILINCILGKDRTGMLVMLLQSLTELSDDVIVNDYVESNNKSSFFDSPEENTDSGDRAYGQLNRGLFSGATKEAMVATLDYLREKYGSISPGYLEHIGFNNMWRRRLRCCLKVSHVSTDNSRMYW